MGRTVGRCFRLSHEVFIGHRLRKKRSDPDFSVQELNGGNIYGCEPTELSGIFPDEEVWRLLSIIVENDCLKEESQLLPNHHIVPVSSCTIAELESQLLPNGSACDGVGDRWVELEPQLLPNRHIVYMAIDITSKLESQLLPNWLIWYEVYVSQLPSYFTGVLTLSRISTTTKASSNREDDVEKNLCSKYFNGEISDTIKSACNKEHHVARNLYSE